MHTKRQLKTINEVKAFIQEHQLAFLYISQPNCSVCHGLLPQVEALLQRYPAIEVGHVDTNDVPEIAGLLSIFTIPVLLLFVDGKEHIREARIVHMDLLNEKIKKIYENVIE